MIFYVLYSFHGVIVEFRSIRDIFSGDVRENVALNFISAVPENSDLLLTTFSRLQIREYAVNFAIS